jgi:hypothetical protein
MVDCPDRAIAPAAHLSLLQVAKEIAPAISIAMEIAPAISIAKEIAPAISIAT